MRLSDIISNMRTTKRRVLAGEIVTAEYARLGLTRDQAASRMHMAPSTLDRVRDGDDRLTIPKLRSVEGALGLPDDLLTFIIEGDLEAIAKIGESEMRPGMRRHILAGLNKIAAEELEGPLSQEGGTMTEQTQ